MLPPYYSDLTLHTVGRYEFTLPSDKNHSYSIRNLQYSDSDPMYIRDTLLESYFSKFFNIDNSMNITTKEYLYDKYFDSFLKHSSIYASLGATEWASQYRS